MSFIIRQAFFSLMCAAFGDCTHRFLLMTIVNFHRFWWLKVKRCLRELGKNNTVLIESGAMKPR